MGDGRSFPRHFNAWRLAAIKIMIMESYILFIEKSSQGDIELMLSILNIAGRGYSFYGSTNDSASLSLWLIFNGKNNLAEIKKQLEAISPIKKVTVITISSPFKETEIKDLRGNSNKIARHTKQVSKKVPILYKKVSLRHN
jgi:hypothetical protein